ncbi:hypothetical protein RRG08_049430 [Elysia crispata]|uniref:Uncharacterized protein n=1 Tax=Elysia crispata TaxID=231223 RepID=A0AAE1DKW0_9GAST|nr:hypothetical protein RRG08_049430 [Elysia crispata]
MFGLSNYEDTFIPTSSKWSHVLYMLKDTTRTQTARKGREKRLPSGWSCCKSFQSSGDTRRAEVYSIQLSEKTKSLIPRDIIVRSSPTPELRRVLGWGGVSPSSSVDTGETSRGNRRRSAFGHECSSGLGLGCPGVPVSPYMARVEETISCGPLRLCARRALIQTSRLHIKEALPKPQTQPICRCIRKISVPDAPPLASGQAAVDGTKPSALPLDDMALPTQTRNNSLREGTAPGHLQPARTARVILGEQSDGAVVDRMLGSPVDPR